MKRLSLAEKCLWYLALISVAAMSGCSAIERAFTPIPPTPAVAAVPATATTPAVPAIPASPGAPAPAATIMQSIGAAIATFNPLVGGALLAAGGAIGHTTGKRSGAKKKPAT